MVVVHFDYWFIILFVNHLHKQGSLLIVDVVFLQWNRAMISIIEHHSLLSSDVFVNVLVFDPASLGQEIGIKMLGE